MQFVPQRLRGFLRAAVFLERQVGEFFKARGLVLCSLNADDRRAQAGGEMFLLRVVFMVVLSECQNRNGALDDPEHGDGADGVGRDEFGPARNWNVDASYERDQRQRHADEQEMAALDT